MRPDERRSCGLLAAASLRHSASNSAGDSAHSLQHSPSMPLADRHHSSRSHALGSAPDLAISRPVQGPAIHRVHSSNPSGFGPFCRRRGTQSPALRLSKGVAHLGALMPPFPHGRSHSMAAHGVCHGAAPVPSTLGCCAPSPGTFGGRASIPRRFPASCVAATSPPRPAASIALAGLECPVS